MFEKIMSPSDIHFRCENFKDINMKYTKISFHRYSCNFILSFHLFDVGRNSQCKNADVVFFSQEDSI